MEQLGRYELLEELGRGAMGVAYKARDPAIDRLVAIKVLVPSAGLDAAQVQNMRVRFQREARAAGRLNHPNIVTVHDVGEDGERAFLVMELIEGQTLDQVLRTRRPLPLDEAVTIGEQVARALDYAHEHGIVHRDIKPANILLTREGVVKVTDFGIARLTGAETTHAGQLLGSPSYMAPEQVTGQPVDGRADIFSLAAVLYELLSGEKAFPGESITTILYRIVHEEPTPLRRLDPAFPAAMELSLVKALTKDPARRYARATDLSRDLRTAGTLRPAEPATTVILPRPVASWRPPSPPRWFWLGGGGIAVVGLVVAIGLWLRSGQTPRAPGPTHPSPARERAATEEEQRKTEADRPVAEKMCLEEQANQQAQEEARRRPSVAGTTPAPGTDDAQMVSIPAGEFWMGSSPEEVERIVDRCKQARFPPRICRALFKAESPPRRLSLDTFYIDRYEVTNALYQRFLEATRRAAPAYWTDGRFNSPTQPVVGVSWHDAQAYCTWAGKRLPTEAEWEKAARGSDARRYPWGNEWDPRRANAAPGLGKPAPVGSFPTGVSSSGIHDLAGNVWEWTTDGYSQSPDRRRVERRTSLSDANQLHVIRGGSWNDHPIRLRSAHRIRQESEYRSATVGFRCAKGTS